MAKITLDSVISGFKSVTRLVSNFSKIEDSLNNDVLWRDNPEGEPNQMEDDLDMNTNRITNLPSPVNDTDAVRWVDVKDGVSGVNEVVPSQSGNEKVALTTNGTSLVFGAVDSDNVDFLQAGTGAVATDVQSKLRETVSVKDFGAVGDGVTDDTVAIQAALDSGAGRVYIPKPSGSFYLLTDNIELKSNQTIEWETGAFLRLTQAATVGHVIGSILTITNVTLINPQIDGGDLGHVVGNQYGENGIGLSHCQNIKVFGGHVKNCRRGTSDFGGKGVQVEGGTSSFVKDVLITGLFIENCSKGFNTQGLPTSPATQIVFTDIIVSNCWEIFQVDQFNSPPTYSSEQQNVLISGITAFNCGLKDYTSAVDTGAIVINRYSHAKVENVTLTNEASYGTIPTFIVDHQGNNNNIEATFTGAVTTLVDLRANASFGTGGSWENSHYKVKHFGTVTTLARSDGSGTFNGLRFDLATNDFVGTFLQLGLITGSSTSSGLYTNLTNGVFISGTLLAIQDSGLDLSTTVADNYLSSDGRYGSFRVTQGGSFDSLDNERNQNVNFKRDGTTKLQLTSSSLWTLIPEYANEAAALGGGLTANELYKTATGEVRIKL